MPRRGAQVDWTGGPPPVAQGPRPSPACPPGPSGIPPLGETTGASFERAVGRVGDRDAVVSGRQAVRLAYGEVDAAVSRIARGLVAAGIAKGDPIGIWSPN